MNTFFKVFFACLLAIVVAGFLMVMVLVGVAGIITSKEKPVVQENSVLYIDLSDKVMEQGREDDLDLNQLNIETVLGLHEVIGSIHHAISDPSIKGIYLHCTRNSLGLAGSQELGSALDSFKASGKPIVAYADVMSMRAYEIAHRATHVYAQPNGMVEWNGYFVEVMFLKNLLDKIAVKPEIFYAGEFKSATEPFRMTRMSDANRLQYQAYLNTIYSSLLLSVARHRGIDTVTLKSMANGLEVRTSEMAFEKGLIDGAIYDDQVRDTLRQLIGLGAGQDIRFVKADKYLAATRKLGTGDRIAVVYADGAIMNGRGADDEIGGDTFRSILSKIRKDKKVKAVVLRVNSPGGSAIASELIWRELEQLKLEKPLVVSMGDYAASGGYYIACGADSIFAQPNTLTGSIGVFTVFVDAQKMFNDKLGINFDGVSTSTYADLGNIARPMTNFERSVVQHDVDTIYHTFKSRVMGGRNLNSDQVEAIAKGRVWSGEDALKIGLVDRLGGMRDAIDCAARMASLEKYSIRSYPQRKSIFDRIFGEKEDPNTTNVRQLAGLFSPQHAGWVREYQFLQKLANVPQTRLPFILQLP